MMITVLISVTNQIVVAGMYNYLLTRFILHSFAFIQQVPQLVVVLYLVK